MTALRNDVVSRMLLKPWQTPGKEEKTSHPFIHPIMDPLPESVDAFVVAGRPLELDYNFSP